MFVIVNWCEQTVPCGTSPKLWLMTGGGVCSRLLAMSGRKNLLAQGAGVCAGCAAGAGGEDFDDSGGPATAPTVKVSPNPVVSTSVRRIVVSSRPAEPDRPGVVP